MDLRPACPFHQVPVSALQFTTRTKLSHLLNPEKVLPSPEGILRDYRGFSHLTNIRGWDGNDPCAYIFKHWELTFPSPTVQDLVDILTKMDRFDTIEDLTSDLEHDCDYYLRIKDRNEDLMNGQLIPEELLLTIDDVHRSRGSPGTKTPQHYDALLLYSEEDISFARLVVKMLEDTFEFKICLRERDLLPGLQFEHTAVMKLISERCTRVIVIISPDFFRCNDNTFFMNFAEAIGIERRSRRIIPFIYREMDPMPDHLKMYVAIRWGDERFGTKEQLWTRLCQSIRPHFVNNKLTERAMLAEASVDAPISPMSCLALPSPPSTLSYPSSLSCHSSSRLSQSSCQPLLSIQTATSPPQTKSRSLMKKIRSMKKWFKKNNKCKEKIMEAGFA